MPGATFGEVLAALVLPLALETIAALVVAIVAYLLARALRGVMMRALQRRKAQGNVIILLGNLAQLLVLLAGALVIVSIYTGPNFAWILTSFSVVGLVIGLSLQDILKNFFAGIWILVERPFRIGDTVEVGMHTGVVEQISFRTTLLRTDDGRQVVLPNSQLMVSPVVNHTAYPLSRATLWLTLDAEHAAADAPARVHDALREVKTVVADPPPAVDLRAVSDGRARFLVSFWTADHSGAVPQAIAALRVRFPGAEVQSA